MAHIELEKLFNQLLEEYHENPESPENYASLFTEFITCTIQLYNKSNENIIYICFDIFENYISKQSSISLQNIYNYKLYDWYYGNILTFLFSLGYRYDLFRIKKQYEHINHQLYIKCYDLITKYNISIYDTDYYGSNIYDCLSYMQTRYPNRIDKYFNSFKFLSKYGIRINSLQKKYSSKFYRKRKEAVQKIENYFFEILYSPYTKIGKKYLEKNAKKFYSLSSTIDFNSNKESL